MDDLDREIMNNDSIRIERFLKTPDQIDLQKVKDYYEDKPNAVERLAIQSNTEPKALWSTIVAVGCALACALLILGCNQAHAEESMEGYTVSQYVEAIYHAEGGEKAEYPYGIRSVKCSTKQECKRIAVNTVVNNFKRYRDYGRNQYPSYVAFLGSRYCPVKGKGLSPAEKKLNGNWVKNVNYFLTKESK